MSKWVPSSVMEVKLLWLIDEGFLSPKNIVGWRAVAGEVFPDPWTGETVSSNDFHEHRFGIPVSNFLHGFLCEYGVEL